MHFLFLIIVLIEVSDSGLTFFFISSLCLEYASIGCLITVLQYICNNIVVTTLNMEIKVKVNFTVQNKEFCL